MRSRIVRFLFSAAVSFGLLPACCGVPCEAAPPETTPPANSAPEGAKPPKPKPPLEIAAPDPLPAKIGDTELDKLAADELFALARATASENSYHLAAIAQYWHVRKSGENRYDLACYLARLDKIDAAFYWLQLAAAEEGVNTRHAASVPALAALRQDARWEKVARYFEDCNRYFETATPPRTVLILPKGYQKGTPIPAVLYLHGYGSNPDDFVNADAQAHADKLNVALIGCSATLPRGPRSFVWAADADADFKRIRAALAEVADRVTVAKGRIVTLGFSQGAQVGVEIAVRFPEEFAGSILLSAGSRSHLAEVEPSPLLAKRGFVLSVNALERPGTVQLTADDADWLRKAKAQVIHKEYPDVASHSFPEDFDERFGEWVKFVLDAGKE
jgi:predicted esterase